LCGAQGMRFCPNPAVAEIQSVTAITFAPAIYSIIMPLLTDAWKRKKSPTAIRFEPSMFFARTSVLGLMRHTYLAFMAIGDDGLDHTNTQTDRQTDREREILRTYLSAEALGALLTGNLNHFRWRERHELHGHYASVLEKSCAKITTDLLRLTA
jgi:hypothetical protein